MIEVYSKNKNIYFAGRNKEIKKAQQILHKIKSDFPASSPYIGDLLVQRCELKQKQPDTFINISNMIENYYKTNNIGAKLTTNKLAMLRRILKNHIYTNNDYKYCDELILGIKKLKVMNCKENSEIAFLIAKMNGYKNCHCINLNKKLSDSSFMNFEHTVLLTNQELPPNLNKIHKFYNQKADKYSAFIPSRKSIVIDPLFQIVDYWENAIQHYKVIFPQISNIKQIWASARNPIIKTPEDIETFKHLHPEFIIKKRS